jgi:hypothetical protein
MEHGTSHPSMLNRTLVAGCGRAMRVEKRQVHFLEF